MDCLTDEHLRSALRLRNAIVEILYGIRNAVEEGADEPLPLTSEQVGTLSAQHKMDIAIMQLDAPQEAEKQMLCAYLDQAADELDALVDRMDAEIEEGTDA